MNTNIEPRLVAFVRKINVIEAIDATAMEFEAKGITLRLEKRARDEQAIIKF
jgi:hypothetical protein